MGYAKKLEDIIVKRVEWADKVFKKLYTGTDGNADAAVEKLQCALIIQMAVFTGDFNGKVDKAVAQMKESYRCSYKCSFNTDVTDSQERATQDHVSDSQLQKNATTS